MHPLYQRLKELDWDTFQRLCFQLIAERHPGASIRHVDGAGGDRGLDLFLGELRSQSTIWQCKHFPNGLGPRQRPQVLRSLRDAVRNFKPAAWILVTSTDLDAKGHAWFQKIQSNYAPKTRVGLFQGSDMVRELIYRRRLREAFLPGTVVDGIMVRRALTELGETSPTELDVRTQEKLDEMIARLEEADARFNYRVTYGHDLGRSVAEEIPKHPMLVASVIDGEKRIDVFARDIQALSVDPPRVGFLVRGTGKAKVEDFLRTGRKQELGKEEVSILKSTFDFLLPKKEIKSWGLVLMPPAGSSDRRLKLRLVFLNAEDKVVYDLVEFKVLRAGAAEAEIESVSKLPFSLSLTLPLAAPFESSFTIREILKGCDVKDAAKFFSAMSTLREGGQLQLFDLEHGKELGVLSIGGTNLPARHDSMENIFGIASEVATKFGVTLRVPDRVTKQDLTSLARMKSIVDGSPLEANTFSATILKDNSRAELVAASLGRDLDVSIAWPRLEPVPNIFGTRIETGPVTMFARHARVKAASRFLQRYSRAADGEAVPISFAGAELRLQLGAATQSQSLMARPSRREPALVDPVQGLANNKMTQSEPER
jgi:hypothetical protein